MKELLKSKFFYFGLANFAAGILVFTTLSDNEALYLISTPFLWVFFSIAILSIYIGQEFIKIKKRSDEEEHKS